MSRRRSVLGVLVAALLCAPLVLGPPAAARILERVTAQQEYSFVVEDWCGVEGLTVEVEGTEEIKFRWILKGRDQLAYSHNVFRVEETHTANGVTTLVRRKELGKALKVTDNGDGTTTVIFLSTGNRTLYGPDGKAIARDPGQSRFRLVFDQGGNRLDPRDDEFISEELLSSTGRSDDFCAAEVPLFT